ncbi:MAG: hypothetical protein ABW146_05250 [Candidatus Sedimenticola sp. 6PFRAG7]
MSRKLHQRYSIESLESGDQQDQHGKLFLSEAGMTDLSAVEVILTSIDTVKQLYKGMPKPDVLERLKSLQESSATILTTPAPLGTKWHLGFAGKASGYQYKLQNNERGVVILLKSFYKEEDRDGNHLKIELSPKFIAERGKKEIQQQLDNIAKSLLDDYKPAGIAIHIAADFQGWEMPDDFLSRFTTRTRVTQDRDAIQKVEFNSLSDVSVNYGDKQSYLFGKANALQIALYRKDREIEVSDKQDHFQRQWDGYTFGQYDKELPVWRLEARLHHRVVRELGNSQGLTLESFSDVVEHLADLWRYALMNNRLDQSRTYIDPIWQLLIEDCRFEHPATGYYFTRKKKESLGNIGKNYSLIIGNMITVFARQGFKVKEVMRELKKLSIYEELLRVYKDNGKTESDLWDQIDKGLSLRRLIGKAA